MIKLAQARPTTLGTPLRLFDDAWWFRRSSAHLVMPAVPEEQQSR